MLRLFALFPYPALVKIGKGLGRGIKFISGSRQVVINTNLARCFPEMSSAERARIRDECYGNIGIALVEMAMCWWWPDEKIKPLVEIVGRENVDKVLQSGQGVILLAGHFTSLEISGRLLTQSMPMQVMYRTQSNELFDSYLYTRRCSYFEHTISRKNTRQMIKGIKNLIPTWYAPDQDFSREKNVFAPFMGIQAATITAGSRIAQATGGAMIPFFTKRKEDGSGYLLTFEPPLENFPGESDLADATAINASIEKYARLYPEYYVWIHQRFKTRPPGEPPFYPPR